MAHSFIEAFPTEVEALRSYARSFPDSSTFLVDTYDTMRGINKAVGLAGEMRRRGSALRAVRLDSGDLLELSTKARALLDRAGLQDVQIFASGGLDEFEIDRLLRAGAPIGGFGVGSMVGVSADAPWTDSAYKLVEYDGRPTLKLSPGKQTLPAAKQVFRYRDAGGTYVRDVISLATEGPPDSGGEPLLHEVMRDGRRLEEPESLGELRDRLAREFRRLPARHKALRSPAMYDVTVSPALARLARDAEVQVRERELGP
jgi:nicotinate phosphoribosyltransferase